MLKIMKKQGGDAVTFNAIAVGNVAARRRVHESALAETKPRIADGVNARDFSIDKGDGGRLFSRWYYPCDTPAAIQRAKTLTSAVLYFHGGGYILGNVPLFDGICSSYVANTDVPFLSVEYRLAPEHPFPSAIEDAYAALRWLCDNAALLSVDEKRIAVMGDSAGGGLAASLTHYCIHKGGLSIAKQILIYPMLDDSNTASICESALTPHLTWTRDDNETGWTALLGAPQTRPWDLPPWAAAARMQDPVPASLPALYMETAELDLFRPENEKYASRLMKGGIEVEIRTRTGCVHGWEHIYPDAEITKQAMKDRWSVIRGL